MLGCAACLPFLCINLWERWTRGKRRKHFKGRVGGRSHLQGHWQQVATDEWAEASDVSERSVAETAPSKFSVRSLGVEEVAAVNFYLRRALERKEGQCDERGDDVGSSSCRGSEARGSSVALARPSVEHGAPLSAQGAAIHGSAPQCPADVRDDVREIRSAQQGLPDDLPHERLDERGSSGRAPDPAGRSQWRQPLVAATAVAGDEEDEAAVVAAIEVVEATAEWGQERRAQAQPAVEMAASQVECEQAGRVSLVHEGVGRMSKGLVTPLGLGGRPASHPPSSPLLRVDGSIDVGDDDDERTVIMTSAELKSGGWCSVQPAPLQPKRRIGAREGTYAMPTNDGVHITIMGAGGRQCVATLD